MLLYFTNNSRQIKKLLETEYEEDIYDEILTFFEEYHIHPHYIKIEPVDRSNYHYVGEEYGRHFEPVCRISFGSYSEFFYCEGLLHIQALKKLFAATESEAER